MTTVVRSYPTTIRRPRAGSGEETDARCDDNGSAAVERLRDLPGMQALREHPQTQLRIASRANTKSRPT
jgi:hypothetical protein